MASSIRDKFYKTEQLFAKKFLCLNLVRRLFDENARKISNISGKGKAQLNPIIISFCKVSGISVLPM